MENSIPYPLKLTTARLFICSPGVDDGPLMHQAIVESFDELHVWMPWAKNLQSLEDTQEYNRRAIEKFQAGEDYVFRMFKRDTNELVGCSGLHRFNWSVPKFEIGYWVRTSEVGRGYATETVRELTRYAFEQLNANRVEIRTDSRNEKSYRIPDRLNYKLEGILRNDERCTDGGLRDTKIYAMTSQDFKT